jgi:hypothetical protein
MPLNHKEKRMPVNIKKTKGFTMQDFIDGKCTREGRAIDKGAEASAPPPEPEPTTSAAVEQSSDATSGPDTSNVEVTDGDPTDTEKG